MYQLRTTDSEIAVIAISGNSICKESYLWLNCSGLNRTEMTVFLRTVRIRTGRGKNTAAHSKFKMAPKDE